MLERALPRPAVTVAAVVEDRGAFLLVRERTRGGLRLNQPAGHLESGETLVAGAARETLEETGWRVEPHAIVGAYRWEAPDDRATFLRFAFAARALGQERQRALDPEIVEVLWLPYEEIVARRAEHRSPLVLRCIDDYRNGARWPLDFVREVEGQGAA